MKALLALLVATTLTLALIAGAVFGLGDREILVPPPEAVVEGFARELATERYGPARNYLSEELKAQMGPDRLQSLTRALKRRTGPIQDVRGEPEWMRADQAEAAAVLKTERGREETLKFELARRSGKWSISDLGDLERPR